MLDEEMFIFCYVKCFNSGYNPTELSSYFGE